MPTYDELHTLQEKAGRLTISVAISAFILPLALSSMFPIDPGIILTMFFIMFFISLLSFIAWYKLKQEEVHLINLDSVKKNTEAFEKMKTTPDPEIFKIIAQQGTLTWNNSSLPTHGLSIDTEVLKSFADTEISRLQGLIEWYSDPKRYWAYKACKQLRIL